MREQGTSVLPLTAIRLYRPPWLRPIVDLPCGECWGRTNVFYSVDSDRQISGVEPVCSTL